MSIKINNESWYTIEEFINKYSITRPTLYNWLKSGKLKRRELMNNVLVKYA